MVFTALYDAESDVCECCHSLCPRGEQRMNVISWSAWSRITTTRTDPGSIPTGTWLWREQASIKRDRRPARARRPSCFCPCQPSADGEMLSNLKRERQSTDSSERLGKPLLSRNASHTDVLGEHYRVYLFVFGHPRYQQYRDFRQFWQAWYDLRSNFPKLIPLSKDRRVGSESSLTVSAPIRSWIRDCISRRNVFSLAKMWVYFKAAPLCKSLVYMQRWWRDSEYIMNVFLVFFSWNFILFFVYIILARKNSFYSF